VFKVKRNKIFVTSVGYYFGNDNAKFIVEELLKRPELSCDIVWAVKEEYLHTSSDLPVRRVVYGSLASIYEQATASVWIMFTFSQLYARKRRGQLYFQLWHGGVGIKGSVKSAEKKMFKGTYLSKQADLLKADYFVSASKHLSNAYRNSFGYHGKILECGYPRNIPLFLCAKAHLVNHYFAVKLRLPADEKFIVYAPTYRNTANSINSIDSSLESYDIDFDNLSAALSERFGGHWTVLLRFHPYIAHLGETFANAHAGVIDISLVDGDINELMCFIDAMITDYSSIINDFVILRRPAFIYANDILEYEKNRGLVTPMKDLPYPCATSNEELAKKIRTFDDHEYAKKVDRFINEYAGIFDSTHSAEVIADLIEKHANALER
jgi:CDP-glycerol glycerophosphotransferase